MRSIISVAALSLALAAAGAAFAQPEGGGGGGGPGGGSGMREACQADMQKYCSSVQPGDRQARFQCMQQHQADFSDACKAAMARMRQMRQQNGGAPPAGGPPPGQ